MSRDLEIFSIYSTSFLPNYLYEETENSKTIFMFDCLHKVVIFGVITYKVQL